jgi:hypothetical protein
VTKFGVPEGGSMTFNAVEVFRVYLADVVDKLLGDLRMINQTKSCASPCRDTRTGGRIKASGYAYNVQYSFSLQKGSTG